YNYTGVILDSYASGTCSGDQESGGLVGENDSLVEESFATGAVSGGVVGGLVGDNAGYIALAYATGSATGSNAYAVGGLVGENQEPPEQLHSLYQTYSTGAVTDGKYLGG